VAFDDAVIVHLLASMMDLIEFNDILHGVFTHHDAIRLKVIDVVFRNNAPLNIPQLNGSTAVYSVMEFVVNEPNIVAAWSSLAGEVKTDENLLRRMMHIQPVENNIREGGTAVNAKRMTRTVKFGGFIREGTKRNIMPRCA
jgi:hypothetical protein